MGMVCANKLVLEWSENMGEVVLKLDCELVYEPEQGIEIHLRHGGSISNEVIEHLTKAARELLQIRYSNKPEPTDKIRTKIEIS